MALSVLLPQQLMSLDWSQLKTHLGRKNPFPLQTTVAASESAGGNECKKQRGRDVMVGREKVIIYKLLLLLWLGVTIRLRGRTAWNGGGFAWHRESCLAGSWADFMNPWPPRNLDHESEWECRHGLLLVLGRWMGSVDKTRKISWGEGNCRFSITISKAKFYH